MPRTRSIHIRNDRKPILKSASHHSFPRTRKHLRDPSKSSLFPKINLAHPHLRHPVPKRCSHTGTPKSVHRRRAADRPPSLSLVMHVASLISVTSSAAVKGEMVDPRTVPSLKESVMTKLRTEWARMKKENMS
jgi:hypothetical protein